MFFRLLINFIFMIISYIVKNYSLALENRITSVK